jgi:glycosyltransferase involved in cell wall biosynthesis
MTESIRDGYNGYVFEVSNPDSLAQVLRRIGDDPTVLNQMKENIPRPPRMEEQAFDYDKLYRALLPGN